MFGFRLVMVDGAQAARPVRPMSERPNDPESRGTFQQLRELARCATYKFKDTGGSRDTQVSMKLKSFHVVDESGPTRNCPHLLRRIKWNFQFGTIEVARDRLTNDASGQKLVCWLHARGVAAPALP